MNVSYGECELGIGTAGNVEYYDLWQTAAAEGIAVFVAAGDSGSASCDDGEDGLHGNPYVAEFGLSVSGLASTPLNTAVGGTDFNWCPLLTAAGGLRHRRMRGLALLEYHEQFHQPVQRHRLRARGAVERHLYQYSIGAVVFGGGVRRLWVSSIHGKQREGLWGDRR